ncbi:hypothetical protein [Spiroplasma culicicola]|uniref:ABC transporter ATP-binding protein n=1 Tax=Spiroplasma culicicola AES-1 TaxID=1276246 RepID=W6A7N4_9MOLU|nr:hypothetical protein [Spiroplasma culicicola]AHI52996.1 hypothetical protein SCULI_v1c06550 [Spiroplasma culicicola AES-1]
MITIKNLNKKYGNNIVLDINQLTIPTGQRIALVGKNGARKINFSRINYGNN